MMAATKRTGSESATSQLSHATGRCWGRSYPVGQERRLARPRRTHHQGEASPLSSVQLVEQPRAVHQVGRRPGGRELRRREPRATRSERNVALRVRHLQSSSCGTGTRDSLAPRRRWLVPERWVHETYLTLRGWRQRSRQQAPSMLVRAALGHRLMKLVITPRTYEITFAGEAVPAIVSCLRGLRCDRGRWHYHAARPTPRPGRPSWHAQPPGGPWP